MKKGGNWMVNHASFCWKQLGQGDCRKHQQRREYWQALWLRNPMG